MFNKILISVLLISVFTTTAANATITEVPRVTIRPDNVSLGTWTLIGGPVQDRLVGWAVSLIERKDPPSEAIFESFARACKGQKQDPLWILQKAITRQYRKVTRE